MQIKNTRHEKFALDEVQKIALYSSIWTQEKITSDAIMRLAVYLFIEKNRRDPLKITKEFIKDAEFKARKSCQG